ncbi:hypothetical protein GCM10011326_13390 [Salipiger profundus]|uniref:Uncharacterized protein n=1 Tax=Salipiger profundus TaxID=1229727 RepID=A0A1U7CZK8_9RHOB|nr:hypothetical protein Ga0080559_TMP516 [Salipiger profundus]GGA03340.1 hypothetical protein GCM10011326_13390 [Salipiger profundus]
MLRMELEVDQAAFNAIERFNTAIRELGAELRWAASSTEDFDEANHLGDPGLVGASRTLIVKKPDLPPGVRAFFSLSSACEWSGLHTDRFEATREFLIAELEAKFRTICCEFAPWDQERPLVCGQRKAPPEGTSPRRIVKLSSTLICPNNALAWIPRDTDLDTIPPCFGTLFASQLGRALAPELQQNSAGELEVYIRGARAQKLSAELPDDVASTLQLLRPLASASEWVFTSEKDADLRHGLLASELAREWEPQLPWFTGLRSRLEFALSNAKAAYSIHLHELGSDALEQMGTLRKALSDDASKMSNLISAMQSAIWRDTAIGAGFIVLRMSTKIPEYAALAVIAYLVVSFSVNLLNISGVFGAVAKESGPVRKRLYHFVHDDDFRNLYTRPLKQVQCKVWGVLGLSAVFSISLACIVLAAAGLFPVNFESSTSTAVETQPAPADGSSQDE